MAMCKLSLIAVLVLCAVLSTSARASASYSAKRVQSILKDIPAEEKPAFLRYALNQGYELVEGKQLEIYNRISHENYGYLYKYYIDNYLITDVNDLPSTRDIICFPTGCIEVGDPGIHP